MAIFSNRRGCGVHHHRPRNFCKWRTVFQDCTAKWISRVGIALVFAVMLVIMLFIFQPFQTEVHVLLMNSKEPPLHITDKNFLSIALDTSVIAEGFPGFNTSDTKLIKMMLPLGGNAYLRIGGTMADRLFFNPIAGTEQQFKSRIDKLMDGDDCAYEGKFCKPLDRPNFTMSGDEWTQINVLANQTGFTILFDLNCLLRYRNGTWDSRNAEELIKFSDAAGFDVIWELGNEPNAFRHVFNYYVSPSQLAEDFKNLRNILKKYERYEKSLLVGPDVTRPRPHHTAAMDYLNLFLKSSDHVVDAITWHQYYFNGKDAYLYYFISPEIFNMLQKEINKVNEVVKVAGYENTPIWLGETSSAYGGGTPGFSDRFISTFIWMDKLGLAAKNGIDVVIRQSLFKGYYALIGDAYEPNPDWWLSVLYKKLVGTNVVECWTAAPPEVRIYCHCNGNNDYVQGPAITVYGINMKNSEAKIKIQEAEVDWFDEYNALAFILQTRISVLSRYVFLNNELLTMINGELPIFKPVNVTSNYLMMPPFSLAFWIIPSNSFVACRVP